MISIDYSLIIVILNFVLLLIVLNKLLFKPMKKFLSDRQQEVEKEMKEVEDVEIVKEDIGELEILEEDEKDINTDISDDEDFSFFYCWGRARIRKALIPGISKNFLP